MPRWVVALGRDRRKFLISCFHQGNRVIMKMDVSYTDHSYIIGRGGNNIKRIMDETQTHIHFPDSNRSNPTEKSNQVSLCGSLEGVEKARSLVRLSTPLLISYELPIMIPGATTYDNNTPFVKEMEKQYGVQVIFSTRPKLHSSMILVKGCEKEHKNVMDATKRLIEFMFEDMANQIPIQMHVEISTQHHPIVLGKGSQNLREIMQRTNTKIIFPDANDMNIRPIKRSQVTISGPIGGAYLARQQLLVSLMKSHGEAKFSNGSFYRETFRSHWFSTIRRSTSMRRASTSWCVHTMFTSLPVKSPVRAPCVLWLRELRSTLPTSTTLAISSWSSLPNESLLLFLRATMDPMTWHTSRTARSRNCLVGQLVTDRFLRSSRSLRSRGAIHPKWTGDHVHRHHHWPRLCCNSTTTWSARCKFRPTQRDEEVTVTYTLADFTASRRREMNQRLPVEAAPIHPLKTLLTMARSTTKRWGETSQWSLLSRTTWTSRAGARWTIQWCIIVIHESLLDFVLWTWHHSKEKCGFQLQFVSIRMNHLRQIWDKFETRLKLELKSLIGQGAGISRTSPAPMETPKTGNAWIDAQPSDGAVGGLFNMTTSLLDTTPQRQRHQLSKYNDIETLLTGIGLQHHVQHFIDGEIDMTVFPTLTENDLINLGVSWRLEVVAQQFV